MSLPQCGKRSSSCLQCDDIHKQYWCEVPHTIVRGLNMVLHDSVWREKKNSV